MQERGTSKDTPPVNASAELKMAAAARQIKAVLPSVAVLMYNPVFPVVDWYDYARNVDQNHTAYLITDANGVPIPWGGCGAGNTTKQNCGGDHVGDFGKVGWQQAWANGMVS